MIAASSAFLIQGTTSSVLPNKQYGAPPSPSPSVSLHGLLTPPAEILSLIEGFLTLKGEVASRFYNIIADNYDLIKGIYDVLVTKVSTLHSFSLAGVQILRRIIEFAIQCLSQWEITVPAISFDGSHQTSGSLPKTSYGTPSEAAVDVSVGGPYER